MATERKEMLHVEEFGPADAPPIVFLHGGLASGWTWQPVVQRLAGEWRCRWGRLPGWGQRLQNPGYARCP